MDRKMPKALHTVFFPSNRRVRTLLLVCGLLALLLAVWGVGFFLTNAAVSANFANARQAPSLQHWFGTDWLGRDVFARTLKGLSLSIAVGTIASLASAVIAVFVGICAATGSRLLDGVITWLIDLVMGVPHLILVLLLSFACGRGFWGLLVGITATHWTGLARLVRAEVLALRSEQYLTVSRRLGKPYRWVLTHHILPHMVPQFVVGLVLLFPHAILHEASVSFLGFGLPPEQPAIGILLAESMQYLSAGIWWPAVLPGLTLVCLVLLFDQLGDALKTLLDPYSAQQ